ncbi:MAG: bifunctional nuclease family protein [Planctomycetes bacterium]|nr:bifunctional nuclease family protein [Planctomycetota bacterium]
MALVEVELTRVMLVETGEQQIVVLQEKGGAERSFPVIIGIFEAVAIHRAIRKEDSPRPMTHDFIMNAFAGLGAEVRRLVVRDLVDGTFLGSLFVQIAGGEREIDCRPSDGIAVAVRAECPIFVDEQVFGKLGPG